MMKKIFNGKEFTANKISNLKKKVKEWGKTIKIVSLCFIEDKSSQIYASKKLEMAKTIGIDFKIINLEFDCPIKEIKKIILELSKDESVSGIMVQKPRKIVYNDHILNNKDRGQLSFIKWWRKITELIPIQKDIDGLSPIVIEKLKIKEDVLVLPATARAVMAILDEFELKDKKILVIGKSDIVGWPLYWQWKKQGLSVEIVGKIELENKLASGNQLKEYQVIVSATGVANLITGEMIDDGVILVDVGEPRGDFNFDSCFLKAKFITPVPGGVGPVTVWAVLENSLALG